MAEKGKEPLSQSKFLTDSDSSDDNEVNTRFKTSVEERQYNTIPGSAIATCIALSYSRPSCQKVKVNKLSTDKTKAKSSDTKHKNK